MSRFDIPMVIPVSSCWQGLNMYLSSIIVNGLNPQRIRAEIIFDHYPELKSVYDLAIELTNIYNKHYDKDVARGKLALWYNKIEKLGYGCFRTVTNTMQNYYETILNYFVSRETNAFCRIIQCKN